MADTDTQHMLAVNELRTQAPIAASYLQTVQSLDVEDDDSCGQMGEMRKELQNALKGVQAKKKRIRKPLAEALREVDQLFKPVLDQLEEAIELTKDKLDRYARNQYAIEEARQKAEREEAQRAAQRATTEAMELRASGAEEVADTLEQHAMHRLQKTEAPAKVDAVRKGAVTVSTVTKWRARVYSVKELCLGVGEGRFPVTCVSVQQKALDELAQVHRKERSKDGVTYYLEIGTATK